MKNGSATLNLLVRLFLHLRVIVNCNLQCHALLYLALQFEYEKRHYLVVFHKLKPQPTRSVCLSVWQQTKEKSNKTVAPHRRCYWNKWRQTTSSLWLSDWICCSQLSNQSFVGWQRQAWLFQGIVRSLLQ